MDQGPRHGCSEPRRKRSRWITAALMLLCGATAAPAWAFDAKDTFKKGTFVLSGEGSYGWQVNDEHFRHVTNLEFYDVGARFSLLPFEPLGHDHFWYGALEFGLEPLYQHYTTPKQAFWGGLSAVVRYHFLALGRVVPYVEIAGSAGGTDLEIPESGRRSRSCCSGESARPCSSRTKRPCTWAIGSSTSPTATRASRIKGSSPTSWSAACRSTSREHPRAQLLSHCTPAHYRDSAS